MPKNQDTTSVKINKIEASHERDKLKWRGKGYSNNGSQRVQARAEKLYFNLTGRNRKQDD